MRTYLHNAQNTRTDTALLLLQHRPLCGDMVCMCVFEIGYWSACKWHKCSIPIMKCGFDVIVRYLIINGCNYVTVVFYLYSLYRAHRKQ